LWPVMRLAFLSPEEGARTSVYLASSPDVEGVSGKYFVKRAACNLSDFANDVESEKKLWEFSERLVESYSL